VNRQFVVWREERREALREEAEDQWKGQAAEYERRWEEWGKENEGKLLKDFTAL